ncbi:MAG: methyltransferase domain-containing protein, partial [Syntrophales bacterium LBB04]|nr:methyltransferase domain-containing protein [Syntrophales bacterium LBB04]
RVAAFSAHALVASQISVICYRGLIYKQSKMFEDAVKAFLQAVEIHPYGAIPWINLGEISLTLNKLTDAKIFFESALSFQSGLTDVLLQLCDLEFRLNAIDDFTLHCDQLLKELGLNRDRALNSMEDIAAMFLDIDFALRHRPQSEALALNILYLLPADYDTICSNWRVTESQTSQDQEKLSFITKKLNELCSTSKTIRKVNEIDSPDGETLPILKEFDGTKQATEIIQLPSPLEKLSGPELVSQKQEPHPAPNGTPWKSLWTQVKVEDILKEPSHQEIADNVTSHIHVQGRKVLDVGCGSGGTGMSLAQYGAIMTLFDMSPDSLELSKKLFHHQGLKGSFTEGNMFCLPFPDNSFDIVTSFGVLEHFQAEEIVRALKEMMRVSSGTVVTTVPNARCAFYQIAKWYSEKTGTWQYGYEKPEYSMDTYFREAGIDLYKEYSIGFIDSLHFLGRLPNVGPLQQIALEFNREKPNAIDGSLIIE